MTSVANIIIDAQSVKNTDTAEQKGYNAGKQVSGIKRHLGVDPTVILVANSPMQTNR